MSDSGPSRSGEAYQIAVRAFSVVILGFGIAMLVVTMARGGGALSLGVLFGVLFVALGGARLYLSLRG